MRAWYLAAASLERGALLRQRHVGQLERLLHLVQSGSQPGRLLGRRPAQATLLLQQVFEGAVMAGGATAATGEGEAASGRVARAPGVIGADARAAHAVEACGDGAACRRSSHLY